MTKEQQLTNDFSLRKRPSFTHHVDPIIVVFPIVSIDAYVSNLTFGNGCRRSNMRRTGPNETQPIFSCPKSSQGGVDLNRNHPMDWNGTFADHEDEDNLGGPCGITYKGAAPWSEPETRAIRDVVLAIRPYAKPSDY